MQLNFTFSLRCLCLLGFIVFSLAALAQKTFFVTPAGTTPAASATSSWATSTTDLQGAIKAATTGDQVWVARGLYTPPAACK